MSDPAAPVLVVSGPSGAGTTTVGRIVAAAAAALQFVAGGYSVVVDGDGHIFPEARDKFARLHARYAELGDRAAHAIDADGTPDAVAHAVLAALSAGRLRVR